MFTSNSTYYEALAKHAKEREAMVLNIIKKWKKEAERVAACKESVKLCSLLTIWHTDDETVEIFSDVVFNPTLAISTVEFEWGSDKVLFILLVQLIHLHDDWDTVIKNSSKQIEFVDKNVGWFKGYPDYETSPLFQHKFIKNGINV